MIKKSQIKNIHAQQVFLFGSSLDGIGADIDLLIVSDDFTGMSTKARVSRLQRNFPGEKIDPQCYTGKEFHRLIKNSTFFDMILKTAIEIHD